jgi:phospholipid/cholesterol/gamma-HCH transport system permease protein
MSWNITLKVEKRIVKTGEIFKGFLLEMSNLTRFYLRFFKEVFKPPYEFSEFAKQSYLVGNKSFLLIASTAIIMGVVLTIQSRPALAQFGAQSWLPAMVAISIVREIGPSITALIFAGKVGSGIGAELASMKITEQIDAMEVSGINPFKYIVVTRILASTLMLPLLVVFADTVSLYGSYFAVNLKDNVSIRLFFLQVFKEINFSDVFPAFIKTFFFGFAIGLVSCYMGYNAGKGTESVGKAANSAVVYGSFLVFIIDMIAVQIASLIT